MKPCPACAIENPIPANAARPVVVYLRLGFLAGIVMMLTEWALDNAPLTTNFSAWYAGNGLAVVAFLLALAGFGYHTSQAGRAIFQDAPGEQRPK